MSIITEEQDLTSEEYGKLWITIVNRNVEIVWNSKEVRDRQVTHSNRATIGTKQEWFSIDTECQS